MDRRPRSVVSSVFVASVHVHHYHHGRHHLDYCLTERWRLIIWEGGQGETLGKKSKIGYQLEKVVGLTDFVIIHVFIASFSPAQGERNQMVNTKFTRPVNDMPMSTTSRPRLCLII